MFGEMFEKYARVVPDGRRRAELYGKYVFKVVSYLLTAAASIALIVELVIAGTEKEPTNAVLAIVGVTVFAWWAFAVMSLACVLVLVAGLAINNYFVKTLRKEVIPLEREIDEKQSRNKIS